MKGIGMVFPKFHENRRKYGENIQNNTPKKFPENTQQREIPEIQIVSIFLLYNFFPKIVAYYYQQRFNLSLTNQYV